MEVSAPHEATRWRKLAGATLLLAMVGCMMGQTTQVRWDLSHGHTKKDVHWTDAQSAHEVADVDLTVQLPGGRTFTGKDVTVRMASAGEQVQLLAVFFPAASLDDAYRHAKELARDWGLSSGSLDAWYQDVLAARRQGTRDRDARFPVAMSGKPLAPEGPTPYAKIVNSFDQEKPGLLDFELQWP